MRLFPRSLPHYQARLLALLAGLITLTALVVWQEWPRPQARLGPHFAPPPPLGPPARVEAGAATQGTFTLLTVTRTQASMTQMPPVINAPRDSQLNTFLRASGDGTGLWIKVAGGYGAREIDVPPATTEKAIPIGRAFLVVSTPPLPPSTPGGHFTYSWTPYQWRDAGGQPIRMQDQQLVCSPASIPSRSLVLALETKQPS